MTIAANPETDPRVIKAEIRDEALTLGFDAIGFAQAGSDPADRTRLAEFVKAGYLNDQDHVIDTFIERFHEALEGGAQVPRGG